MISAVLGNCFSKQKSPRGRFYFSINFFKLFFHFFFDEMIIFQFTPFKVLSVLVYRGIELNFFFDNGRPRTAFYWVLLGFTGF